MDLEVRLSVCIAVAEVERAVGRTVDADGDVVGAGPVTGQRDVSVLTEMNDQVSRSDRVGVPQKEGRFGWSKDAGRRRSVSVPVSDDWNVSTLSELKVEIRELGVPAVGEREQRSVRPEYSECGSSGRWMRNLRGGLPLLSVAGAEENRGRR